MSVAHRSIRLIPEACTSCMICVRACPTWCINLDAHPETVEVPGSRPRTRPVLDDFRIDWALCMYCGACVELCPFDALEWEQSGVRAEPVRSALVAGLDALSAPPEPPSSGRAS